MGNAPGLLHLLGEMVAGTDLWWDAVMDLGILWDVVWAGQGREGPAARSCSDCSGSFSMMPVPGSEPGWAGARRGWRALRGHMHDPNKREKVTGEAAQPVPPGRDRGRCRVRVTGSGLGAGPGPLRSRCGGGAGRGRCAAGRGRAGIGAGPGLGAGPAGPGRDRGRAGAPGAAAGP